MTPADADVRGTDGVMIRVRAYDARTESSQGARDASRCVVLAHANGFHGSVFAPLIAGLCARGYACYALDFRGHGRSTSPVNGRLEWSALGEDCAAVVTALGLHGCHAFGHSCGGHALLMAEARRPGMFRSIYAFEPIFIVPQNALEAYDVSPGSPLMASTEYLVKSATRRRARFASLAEALSTYRSKPPMNALDSRALEAYVNDGGFVSDDDNDNKGAQGGVKLACSVDTEVSIYRSGEGAADAFASLPRVACPVVIAKGTSFAPDGTSPIYSAVIAPALAAAVQRGKVVEFPNLSHFGPMERPDDVAESVVDFISTARAAHSKL